MSKAYKHLSIAKTIKDSECGAKTPLIYGHLESPVYEKEQSIKPRYPGRQETS